MAGYHALKSDLLGIPRLAFLGPLTNGGEGRVCFNVMPMSSRECAIATQWCGTIRHRLAFPELLH